MPTRAARLAFAVLALALATPAREAGAQRCDTNIRIVNNSSSTVRGIYFNPSSNSSWGPNRLGGTVLQPRQSVTFRLAFEANYDFRIAWDAVATAEMRHTDICRISAVVITDEGLRVR